MAWVTEVCHWRPAGGADGPNNWSEEYGVAGLKGSEASGGTLWQLPAGEGESPVGPAISKAFRAECRGDLARVFLPQGL